MLWNYERQRVPLSDVGVASPQEKGVAGEAAWG